MPGLRKPIFCLDVKARDIALRPSKARKPGGRKVCGRLFRGSLLVHDVWIALLRLRHGSKYGSQVARGAEGMADSDTRGGNGSKYGSEVARAVEDMADSDTRGGNGSKYGAEVARAVEDMSGSETWRGR